METTPTIDTSIHDLMYLLHDLRQMLWIECKHHEPEDCEPGRGYCPIKLHERMTALHDDTPAWRLIRAAPDLLEALRDVSQSLNDFYAADHVTAGQHFGMALRERIDNAIAKAS